MLNKRKHFKFTCFQYQPTWLPFSCPSNIQILPIFATAFVMLENYTGMMLQPQDYHDGTITVQQDGSLPHFHTEVFACVVALFPSKWTECVAPVPLP